MWLLLLVVFLSGCTVVIKDREAVPQRERERATGPLRAYCPSKIETGVVVVEAVVLRCGD
jgi:uncharacterized protein YceK